MVASIVLAVWVTVWWVALRIVEHPSWPPPADAVTAHDARESTERFLQIDHPGIGDLAISYAPSTAATVDLYSDGMAFFPGMLSDIGHARHSIHIIMFGITEGEIATEFVDELIRQSLAGIEVRLIVDGYGAKVDGQSKPYFAAMSEAGVQIVVHQEFPFDRDGLYPAQFFDWRQDEVGSADHRKMLVIDGAIGWIGGGGLQDHFNSGSFYDVFARVTGDIVLQMQAVFLTSFSALGGFSGQQFDDLITYFPQPDVPGTIRTTLIQNIPGGFLAGTQASRSTIENASRRLDIMNPYFTDPGIIDKVIEAARSGVEVRLVVPGVSNNVPADSALRHNFPRLIAAGVAIYEYPVVMHAKMAIADDSMIIGTINYDAWAMYRNLEIALLIEDKQTVERALTDVVEPAIARSHPANVPGGRIDRIRGWIWDKLVYFL